MTTAVSQEQDDVFGDVKHFFMFIITSHSYRHDFHQNYLNFIYLYHSKIAIWALLK